MQKGCRQTAVACPQGALAALQQGNPGGGSEGALEGVLTHSLTGLSETHVSMFLDVATILRGERMQEVRAVWKAWHGDAAATYHADLVRRSLLGTDEKGRLVTHDVLVALGRGIILQSKGGLEEHFGSRMWVQDWQVMGCAQVWLPRASHSVRWSALACDVFQLRAVPGKHVCHSGQVFKYREQMCSIAGTGALRAGGRGAFCCR
jgi:hypothetical protein